MRGLISKLFARAFSWQPPNSAIFFRNLAYGFEQCVYSTGWLYAFPKKCSGMQNISFCVLPLFENDNPIHQKMNMHDIPTTFLSLHLVKHDDCGRPLGQIGLWYMITLWINLRTDKDFMFLGFIMLLQFDNIFLLCCKLLWSAGNTRREELICI